MRKRGQITIFIILGIIIVVAIVLFFVLRSDVLKKTTERQISTTLSLSESVELVEGVVQSCLDNALVESFHECSLTSGSQKICLEKNVRKNVLDCVEFEKMDVEVYPGEIKKLDIDFSAGGTIITANMEFDIVVKAGDGSERLKNFYSEIVRAK